MNDPLAFDAFRNGTDRIGMAVFSADTVEAVKAAAADFRQSLRVTVEGLTAGTVYDVTVTPLNVWLDAGEPIACRITAQD